MSPLLQIPLPRVGFSSIPFRRRCREPYQPDAAAAAAVQRSVDESALTCVNIEHGVAQIKEDKSLDKFHPFVGSAAGVDRRRRSSVDDLALTCITVEHDICSRYLLVLLLRVGGAHQRYRRQTWWRRCWQSQEEGRHAPAGVHFAQDKEDPPHPHQLRLTHEHARSEVSRASLKQILFSSLLGEPHIFPNHETLLVDKESRLQTSESEHTRGEAGLRRKAARRPTTIQRAGRPVAEQREREHVVARFCIIR